MAKRRLLPEAAYDFWVRDGRDGETSTRRDTLAEAQADAKRWRKTVDPWRRSVFEIRWAVNETKVLRLLRSAHVQGEPKKEGTDR